MSRTVRLNLNRVEGDLELEVDVESGFVTDARCIGTLYRGFEQILLKRDPLDALAITPRICGICSTAHLYAAVLALESAANVTPTANGIRVRNSCLLAEEIQSDCRHTFLMFTPDLCSERYESQQGYAEIKQAFDFMQGSIYREAVIESRRIIEIVALFGGQWPHSSHMVPGGVTSPADRTKLVDALTILNLYSRWFEKRILGCSLEQWSAIKTKTDLLNWFDGNKGRESAAGQLSIFCRELKLHAKGLANSTLLSYGNVINPDSPNQRLRKSGVYDATSGEIDVFDQQLIEEDISHSWFHDDNSLPRHPFEGKTQPKYDPESQKYSWAKAPRYNGKVAHTGSLSQLICDADPLITDLFRQEGNNSWLRQFSRIQRQALSLNLLRQQLIGLQNNFDLPYTHNNIQPIKEGKGFGLIEAARGGLGHWVRIENGVFTKYQIVTPTAWNASPRDVNNQLGHIEQTLIGAKIADEENPIELGHIIRSHDPCLVCTVHVLGSNKKLTVETL